jgi:hypothetical protein
MFLEFFEKDGDWLNIKSQSGSGLLRVVAVERGEQGGSNGG